MVIAEKKKCITNMKYILNKLRGAVGGKNAYCSEKIDTALRANINYVQLIIHPPPGS